MTSVRNLPSNSNFKFLVTYPLSYQNHNYELYNFKHIRIIIDECHPCFLLEEKPSCGSKLSCQWHVWVFVQTRIEDKMNGRGAHLGMLCYAAKNNTWYRSIMSYHGITGNYSLPEKIIVWSTQWSCLLKENISRGIINTSYFVLFFSTLTIKFK